MRWRLGLLLCFVAFLSFAQKRPEIDLETFAERLFQIQDEDVSYEDLYESLFLFYTSPLNLNKATKEELASLYILNPQQLIEILSYREQYGDFISLYELQNVPHLDLETVRDLIPFVTVTESSDSRKLLTRILNEENNYLLLRYTRSIQTERGFDESRENGYQGNPGTIYGRMRIRHSKDFSVGLTFEKDAGEPFSLDDKPYGFDFYSFHFLLENKGKIKTLALGDYQLQMGQGLVFGSGFSPGKGAETIHTTKRNSVGIRPYSSVLESGFFRGAAATVSLGQFEVTALGSHLKQDALLQNDTTYSDYEEFINSIQATGMHRTPNEIASRNQITESNLGFALNFEPSYRFSAGITALHTQFSRPLQRKPNTYNQFEFQGEQNTIGSAYFNYNFQNFILFGESGISSSGGIGAVGGLIASLTSKIDFSLNFRHFDKDFHSFYGNAFSEGSRIINERGTYWGIKYKPNRQWQFAAYFDRFSFPWLRFRVDAPSKGHEMLGRVTYSPTRKIKAYLQYRFEQKERSITPEGSNTSRLIPTHKGNYLFNMDYELGPVLSFKTRVQGSFYEENQVTTKGLALIQDVNMTFRKWKLSTRIAVFETDDYDNRQYVYEKDVLYAFSIPAYSGVGIRNYLLLQYSASRYLTCYARYGRFQYSERQTSNIGSGNDLIDGNIKSDFKIMARWKFLR